MLKSTMAQVNSNTALTPPNTLTIDPFKVALLHKCPNLGLQQRNRNLGKLNCKKSLLRQLKA